jgi:type I restriction enzyme M protein
MSAQNGLVQRLWSYCNILRDDGLSYGDCLEQLTYLQAFAPSLTCL